MTDDEPDRAPMAMTGLRLPKALLARIAKVAHDQRRTRADMTRVLLEDALKPYEQAQATPAAVPVAASSTRSERAARREDGHPFTPGANPLKCKTCGVSQAKHP